MTSAQSMQFHPRAIVRLWLLSLCVILNGCASPQRLEPPASLRSPYERPALWAVVPFNNESGVSTVRTDRVADAFTEQAEQVDGLHAVPVNRVIAAMRIGGIRSITNANDAMVLMNALGVDGLIVGTITTYDAYPPLKLGAAIQLYGRDRHPSHHLDPLAETRATGDRAASMSAMNSTTPVAQAAGVFDASNHQVLTWLNEFATGRNEPGSAYGRDRYLVSMELYTQFVAYRLLRDLLESERSRLLPTPPTSSDAATRSGDANTKR